MGRNITSLWIFRAIRAPPPPSPSVIGDDSGSVCSRMLSGVSEREGELSKLRIRSALVIQDTFETATVDRDPGR